MVDFVMIYDSCRSVRAKPLYIDPGLYNKTKSDIFHVYPERSLPTSFKLFSGIYRSNTG